MEREYKLGVSDKEDPETAIGLQAYLEKALGKAKEGKKGSARNIKKLFHALKTFCKEQSLDIQGLVQEEAGTKIIAGLNGQARARLKEIVFSEEYGIDHEDKGETYRIKIGNKSDPEMVVAGNDTASCMPFGSGKNNVYMFNPNCTQLVMQRKTSDGSWRTAAQSVMTMDAKSSKPTPELINGYSNHISLKDLFEARDFANPRVLTCDNIEVAKNEEGNRVEAIREVYTRFFTEYLQKYAQALDIDAGRVVVGQGYTPKSLRLKSEANTYVPLAPMGYSDNVHQNCYVIETGLTANEPPVRKNVRPLKTTDALAAAYIEGKAYHDNDSLLEYLHKIQNNIIGKEIANAKFKRPELSFMAENDDKVPLAYLIAYEGITGQDKNAQIFIADLAADPDNKMAAPALVRTFLRAYFENYGTEEKTFVPIYTNAREKTSYRWIIKLAENMAQKYGAKIEIQETETYQAGADTMHNVRIYIGLTQEEIEEQKRRFANDNGEYDQGYHEEESYDDEESW